MNLDFFFFPNEVKFIFFCLLEQSLNNLDGAITRSKGKINRLDQEIRRAVREQVGAGSKGKQSLEQAKKDIQVSSINKSFFVEMIEIILHRICIHELMIFKIKQKAQKRW